MQLTESVWQSWGRHQTPKGPGKKDLVIHLWPEVLHWLKIGNNLCRQSTW